MDRNFDKVTYLTDHDDMHDRKREKHQVNELNAKLTVQREIIAEQAIKIQKLQKKLKKFGWNS